MLRETGLGSVWCLVAIIHPRSVYVVSVIFESGGALMRTPVIAHNHVISTHPTIKKYGPMGDSAVKYGISLLLSNKGSMLSV